MSSLSRPRLPSTPTPVTPAPTSPSAEALRLEPGQRALVGTGVRIALPEGHVAFVVPRSGLATKHGITIVNAPGTVDAGLPRRDQSHTLEHRRRARFDIAPGDRIAQLIVMPVPRARFIPVESCPTAPRRRRIRIDRLPGGHSPAADERQRVLAGNSPRPKRRKRRSQRMTDATPDDAEETTAATVSADRAQTGPFDKSEANPVRPYIDLGGIKILPREGRAEHLGCRGLDGLVRRRDPVVRHAVPGVAGIFSGMRSRGGMGDPPRTTTMERKRSSTLAAASTSDVAYPPMTPRRNQRGPSTPMKRARRLPAEPSAPARTGTSASSSAPSGPSRSSTRPPCWRICWGSARASPPRDRSSGAPRTAAPAGSTRRSPGRRRRCAWSAPRPRGGDSGPRAAGS